MGFFEWIDGLDRVAFTAVQRYAAAYAWQDNLMLLLRNATTWIPLYLFILIWVLRNARSHAFTFIVLTIATFAFCDFVSAGLLKPLVGRLRPCYDVNMAATVRELVGCGGRFSFPSSHAANHFGLAAFWFFAIRHVTGKRWYWLWFWAALICFAQVYVGKHFPMDVISGALLGILVGLTSATIFKHWQPRWYRRQKHPNLVQTS